MFKGVREASRIEHGLSKGLVSNTAATDPGSVGHHDYGARAGPPAVRGPFR